MPRLPPYRAGMERLKPPIWRAKSEMGRGLNLAVLADLAVLARRREPAQSERPTMVNIRQDPFERTPSIGGQSLNDLGGGYMNDFFAREFWRFVLVQHQVAKLAETAIDYPPMQDPASFNLDAVKRQIEAAIKNKPGE